MKTTLVRWSGGWQFYFGSMTVSWWRISWRLRRSLHWGVFRLDNGGWMVMLGCIAFGKVKGDDNGR